MRAFYLLWPEQKISRTLSGKSSNDIDFSTIGNISSTISILSAHFALPWSTYVRLLSVKRPEARSFYGTGALRLGGPSGSLTAKSAANFTSASRSPRARPQCWRRLKLPNPVI
jgi:hypothetical protein